MKKKSINLQSSSRIQSYEDNDKKSIIIKPQWILYFGFFISFFILFISYIYGTWPNIH